MIDNFINVAEFEVADSASRKSTRKKANNRKTQKHKKVIFAVKWRRNGTAGVAAAIE